MIGYFGGKQMKYVVSQHYNNKFSINILLRGSVLTFNWYLQSKHFTDTFSINILWLARQVHSQHFLIILIENIIWSALCFLQNVFAVANRLYTNLISRRKGCLNSRFTMPHVGFARARDSSANGTCSGVITEKGHGMQLFEPLLTLTSLNS